MSNLSSLHAVARLNRAIPVSNTGYGVRIVNPDEIYQEYSDAGCAYAGELIRVFGKHAWAARFDDRKASTPRLRELHDAYRAAEKTYLASLSADKPPLPRRHEANKSSAFSVRAGRKAA